MNLYPDKANKCAVCGADAKRRCSACVVRYCSKECQEGDWIRHKFDCNANAVTTADHLVRAVYRDLLPEDPQTCQDYGFAKAFTVENRTNLLGLYIGLIKYMEIPARKIHKWRMSGTLVPEIKAAYYQLPESSRGEYFPWFLKNQHLLGSTPSNLDHHVDNMILRGAHYARIPSSYTVDQIRSLLATWPKNKVICINMCTKLLSQWHPAPFEEHWVKFGFCACANEEEESALGVLYSTLLTKCTFEQFCNAYDSSFLLGLMDSCGFKDDRKCFAHLEDVLSGSPGWFKSVWYLKQYVVAEEVPIIRSVFADYGFMNCKTETEIDDLKKIYKQLFLRADVNPIELHQAAISGKLFEYASRFMKFNKAKKRKFSQLMKNLYPLPDIPAENTSVVRRLRDSVQISPPTSSSASLSGQSTPAVVQTSRSRVIATFVSLALVIYFCVFA